MNKEQFNHICKAIHEIGDRILHSKEVNTIAEGCKNSKELRMKIYRIGLENVYKIKPEWVKGYKFDVLLEELIKDMESKL